jgi:hypothetical protein
MKNANADEYKSMKLPKWVYDNLKAAQEDILRRGLNTIPEELIPPECRHLKTVTIGIVAGIALRALAASSKKNGSKK